MSVCLWMIPIALAVRAVVGEKKIMEMAAQNEIRVSSGISEKQDIMVALKKNGYNIKDFSGSIKVHVKNGSDYFFVDKIDGYWTFCFPKYLGEDYIKDFINEFEQNGQKIELKNELENFDQQKSMDFPTNFKDKELLKNTIKDFGISVEERSEGVLECSSGGDSIRFIQEDKDSPFFVRFESFKEASEMLSLVGVLDESYRSRIQKMTYQTIKEKVKDSEYKIVSEKREKDRSIVITLKTGD